VRVKMSNNIKTFGELLEKLNKFDNIIFKELKTIYKIKIMASGGGYVAFTLPKRRKYKNQLQVIYSTAVRIKNQNNKEVEI
jgi:hypothetical protein